MLRTTYMLNPIIAPAAVICARSRNSQLVAHAQWHVYAAVAGGGVDAPPATRPSIGTGSGMPIGPSPPPPHMECGSATSLMSDPFKLASHKPAAAEVVPAAIATRVPSAIEVRLSERTLRGEIV